MKKSTVLIVAFILAILYSVSGQGRPPRTLKFIPAPAGGCTAPDGTIYYWYGVISDFRFFDNSAVDPANPLYFNVHIKGACYDFNTSPIEVKFSNVE